MAFDLKKFMKEIPAGTVLNVPIFSQYIAPVGYLSHNVEDHALFYYYINARRTYEELILNTPLQMEGDPDHTYDFRQLFESIAGLYNVQTEAMAKAWSTIDKQCEMLNLPLMPNEPKYRFADSIIIRTQ